MRYSHQISRRRLLLGAATSGLLLAARSPRAAGGRTIEIGLMPYMPTARLLESHESLRRHMETTFGRPAVLSTAPDFLRFQRRVLRGDFDFVVSGGNLAWQAHLDAGLTPVAMSRKFVVVQIVVAKRSTLHTMTDLQGKTLVTIDPITTVGQVMNQMLRDAGLEPGRDVRVMHEKTPFNCAQAVALGEADAAGFPDIARGGLTAELRNNLRILKESAPLPGVILLARRTPDMPAPEDFQSALFRFAQTREGQIFIRELGHEALIKPDFKRLKDVDRLLPELRRILAAP